MPSLTRSLRRLANLFEQRGGPDAFIECVARVLELLSIGTITLKRYYVFSQPLAALPPAGRRGTSIIVRLIGSEDDALNRMPRPRSEMQARFAAGAGCVIAEVGDAVAGFLWFQQGTFDDPETGVRFIPAPAEATVWDFDVFVHPQHRGGLVFYRLWSQAGEILRARGVSHSVSLVWAHNDDSIRSHQRLGAFPIASAYQVRIGRKVLQFADRSPRIRWLPSALPPSYVVDAGAAARRVFARFPSAPPPGQRSTSAGAG